MELLASKWRMSVGSVILALLQRKWVTMNLDEYKAYVEASRKASAEKAMSVLSATITTNKKESGSN